MSTGSQLSQAQKILETNSGVQFDSRIERPEVIHIHSVEDEDDETWHVGTERGKKRSGHVEPLVVVSKNNRV